MMNRFICGITFLAGLILTAPAAFAQDAAPTPVVPERPRPVVTLTKTIGSDLKSLFSADNVPVLSSATALALFASPFDKTLTFQASSSTFLKTSFDGWARVVGQEW